MAVKKFTIRNIKIENYKSIKDLSIRLNEGLNILIGDNGAGKSNFLHFLMTQVMSDFRGLIYRGGRAKEDFYKGANYSIDIEYTYRNDIFTTHFSSLNSRIKRLKVGFDNQRILKFSKYKNGKPVYKNIELVIDRKKEEDNLYSEATKKIRQEIRSTGMSSSIQIIPFDTPSELAYISQPGKLIFKDGGQVDEESSIRYNSYLFLMFDFELAEKLVESSIKKINESAIEKIKSVVFDTFEGKKRVNKLAQSLKTFTPIQDIRLNENINAYVVDGNIIVENIILNFKVSNNWVPWSYLSDGTKRLFLIFTEILTRNSPVILIEEPELGVHPSQLYNLLNFLKRQSLEKQIIISTHSPISLDILGPEELDNIIITKMTKAGTKMQHLNPSQKSKAQAYIKKVNSLSDYWLHSDLEK